MDLLGIVSLSGEFFLEDFVLDQVVLLKRGKLADDFVLLDQELVGRVLFDCKEDCFYVVTSFTQCDILPLNLQKLIVVVSLCAFDVSHSGVVAFVGVV